jgi:hypothetical protein
LATYTTEAATDVGAQNGKIPSQSPSTTAQPTASTVAQQALGTTISSGGEEPLVPPASTAFAKMVTPLEQLLQEGKAPPSLGVASSLSLGRTPTSGVWIDGLYVLLIVGAALLGLFSAPLALLFGRWRRRW